LVKIRVSGSRVPLFLIHPAGGNVLCYAALARQLHPDRPVYGFQALGLEEEQEPLGSVEEMAETYLSELQRLRPEGPYLLAGWSLGGHVAFEMARRFEVMGEAAMVLLLDSFPAEAYPTPSGTRDDAEVYVSLLRNAEGDRAGSSLEVYRGLEEQARFELFLTEAIRRGLFPPDLPRGRVQQLLHLFRINTSLAYQPQPFAGPVALLHVREHPEVPLEQLLKAWRPYVLGFFEVREVPGSHETLVNAPHAKALAGELELCLQLGLERLAGKS